jgi:acetyl esterase
MSTMIRRLRTTLRRTAGMFVVDNAFRGLARLGRLHPRARPAEHGVEVIRDVPYLHSGMSEHLLDVYKPIHAKGPLPVVLYVHGGGFRILSKDTHWMMGLAFARRGYLVFNISYRLAPKHRYPAAIDDACAAYLWVVKNAAKYGGDVSRLILAGESAGGNLVAALAVAASWRRPEPWARALFDVGVPPVAVLPACGLLQVSNPERFLRKKKITPFLYDRIWEVTIAYLGKDYAERAIDLGLADPLCVIEGPTAPDRPLPPFFSFVGTADPLLDDTRRLHAALTRRGVPSEVRYYPGEVHAFHAMVWRPSARRLWQEKFAFLQAQLSSLAETMTSSAAASVG